MYVQVCCRSAGCPTETAGGMLTATAGVVSLDGLLLVVHIHNTVLHRDRESDEGHGA